MAKQVYETITSEKGTANYFKVNTTIDIFKTPGKPDQELGYIANVYFDKATTTTMIADIDTRIAAEQASDHNFDVKGKPKKWLAEPFVPYATDDQGEVFFKFKTSHLRKDTAERRYIPMFDAAGKPMGNKVAIGNGSIVKISYSPSCYHVSGNVNGLKFFLNAIQVLELVTFGGGSSSSFGFSEEDGYSAPVDENNIDDPFDA
jgi:hypothetical protein